MAHLDGLNIRRCFVFDDQVELSQLYSAIQFEARGIYDRTIRALKTRHFGFIEVPSEMNEAVASKMENGVIYMWVREADSYSRARFLLHSVNMPRAVVTAIYFLKQNFSRKMFQKYLVNMRCVAMMKFINIEFASLEMHKYFPNQHLRDGVFKRLKAYNANCMLVKVRRRRLKSVLLFFLEA